MTTDKLYEVLRALLGDRQVHGFWFYEDATLRSAIRACFFLSRAPDGYSLTQADDNDTIAPELSGDAGALVAYQAGLILVGGEDGEVRMSTRDVTLADSGHRKRDLLDEFRQKIYEVRDGNAVFGTFQSLVAYLHVIQSSETTGGLGILATGVEANVHPLAPDLVI